MTVMRIISPILTAAGGHGLEFYVLSWHGFFLGVEPQAAVWTSPNSRINTDTMLCLTLEPGHGPPDFMAFLGNPAAQGVTVELPGYGECQMVSVNPSGIVAFRHGDRYLRAVPEGSTDLEARSVSGWEKFLLVPQASMDQLRFMLTENWVIGSSRSYVSKYDVRVTAGHHLSVGPLELPLAYNLPLDEHFAPFRFPVHRGEGWRIDQIMVYRPLIFYVAFGEDAVDQLCISLNSLFRIGRYDGRVLVFTDATPEALNARVMGAEPWQIQLAPHPATEWVGYVAGKYAILEEELAYTCAPVIYMDPDIVFNTDIRPMLLDVLGGGRPAAAIEYWSKLATWPSVGSTLLREDYAGPEIASGFNCGTLALPNLKEHGYLFSLIRRTIQNYLSVHGRGALKYVDQEVCNYISYKFSQFDTRDLTRYVRYGFPHDAAQLGSLSGLVHFCGIYRTERKGPMQRYLNLLYAEYKTI